MNPHERVVRALLDAVVVRRSGAWSWFGRRVDPPIDVPVSSRRPAVLSGLQRRLYDGFYIHGRPVPAGISAPAPGRPGPFAADLAMAGGGRRARQPGWRVVDAAGDRLLIESAGLRVAAAAEDVVVAGGAAPTPGTTVDALLPASLESAGPGVLLLGARTLADDPEEPVDRLYWHVAARGAARLAAHLTAALDEEQIPFRLKAPAVPEGYRRCDAAVLYTLRPDRARVVEAARGVHARMAADLRPATPALTLRLSEGLALAEEPSGGESFGEHRCQLLGEALLLAAERGAADQDERVAVVRERFAEDGIDLDVPWKAGLAP